MGTKTINKHLYNRLPIPLQELTKNFEGREKDIVLLSSLAVLSNCFPNIHGEYDGDIVYPHIYVLIIAPAASGKGVMNYPRHLIEKIHDKIFNDSLREVHEFERKSKKDNKEQCPSVKVKILPANTSTAEMYSLMGSSAHGLIIIESEADTMSSMLKNDWSNYSDVLRKAFHHEHLSITRKTERVFEDIKEPKLAMLISGTPDQLKPLIKSRENGLFSRFITYNFDEISPFKNVFEKKSRNNRLLFKDMGEKIFTLYGKLRVLKSPILFSFTERQEEKFFKRIDPIRTDIIDNHSQSFVPNLHRHALILYRLAMLLTIVRNMDAVHTEQKLICRNDDFMLALRLMQTLLRHSQYTFDSLDTSSLTLQDMKILDNLKISFTRKDAIEVGEKMDIPSRTIDDKLSQFQNKRLIKRAKRGEFVKL